MVVRDANDELKQTASAYVYHQNEPKNLNLLKLPTSEVEHELLANRFFLKRRVWKNMDKIKRLNSRDMHHYSERRPRAVRRRHLTAEI